MFDFSLIQQFSCWVDQYQVNHLWKSSLFDSSSSIFCFCFLQPKATNPKCKLVILVFKSKKRYCMYFTIFQRGSLEESVTKNTFNSILILCLYKFRSGYVQIIQIFFINSNNRGGGNFSPFNWIFYLDQNRIPIEKMHITNFKIAMEIIFDHFGPKNGKILLFSYRTPTTVPKNSFFGCRLIVIPYIIFDL